MLIGVLAALAVVLVATPDGARAGRGAAGLVLAALAALSLLTGTGTLEPARLARVGMTAAVPPGFLEASLALLVLGLVVAVAGSRSRLAVLASAGVIVILAPALRAISLVRATGLLVLFAGCLYGLVTVIGALRSRFRSERPVDAWPVPAPAAAAGPANLGFVTALVALLSPWAWLIFVASVVGFASALALPLRRLQRLLVGVSGLLVLGAAVSAAVATGPPPDPAAPSADLLSASRSIVVAGLLLLPSAVALAVWPWHRLAPGLVLAPAALALVGRYAADAVPLGLAWWLPAVFPVALAGVGYALHRGHGAGVLGSASWVGLWIGTPGSRLGAALLAGAAMLLAVTPAAPVSRWQRAAGRIPMVAGGAGLVLVLHGGLSVQVVYTTLLALITAIGLMLPRDVAAVKARA